MRYSCLLFIILSISCSCSSFSSLAKKTNIKPDDYYVVTKNYKAEFQSTTFGDFEFATSQKDFKSLSNKKPAFKNILLYATTSDPAYDYYIFQDLKNTPDTNDRFWIKQISCKGQPLVLAISKKAPDTDVEFILRGFICDEE